MDDDKKKILTYLEKQPAGAADIARDTGLKSPWLASLLMRLEKENLIVWDQGIWRLPRSSKRRQKELDA